MRSIEASTEPAEPCRLPRAFGADPYAVGNDMRQIPAISEKFARLCVFVGVSQHDVCLTPPAFCLLFKDQPRFGFGKATVIV